MTYILLERATVVGGGSGYRAVLESNDIIKIEEKIKNYVKSGCPVNSLRIVSDIPFEFLCGIKLKCEGDA